MTVPRRALALILAAFFATAVGCSPDDRNFTDYPGFAEHYATYPPRTTTPTESERALLERYRPRIFLPEGNEGPIDFYRDYIAYGTLWNENGEIVSDDVAPEILNSVRKTRAVFSHRASNTPTNPVVYARIDQENFELGGRTREFTFLNYTLVFRHSGVAAGTAGLRGFLLSLIGDLDDWHQLDHYTSVTIALDEELRPRAACFQHHNHMRTYILGATEGTGKLALPPDGRIAIDVAIRSNELYPHASEGAEHRVVPLMDEDSISYLIMGGDAPFMSSIDITSPDKEIDPPLAYLAPVDAFYTFRGWLGERRSLPGRDGPPGADYNTLPSLKNRSLQMIVFHWWNGDHNYAKWFQNAERDGRHKFSSSGLTPFRERFAKMLDAL